MSNSSQTGFTSISAKFDTTGIENPFYESSSKGDSLIEQMKNNILLVNEVEINVRETKIGCEFENKEFKIYMKDVLIYSNER